MPELAEFNIARLAVPIDDPDFQPYLEAVAAVEAESEAAEGPAMVPWWIPTGHRPAADESRQRLATLGAQGPTTEAFNFAKSFPAPGAA